MKKFKVYGITTVAVSKEIWAHTEDEAMEKAWQQLPSLTAFCGNGSTDKLVGVYDHDASVDVIEDIAYDEAEVIEDDPDYFECSECGEECERRTDANGMEYWYCEECCQAYNDDGDVVYPETEDDE